ncbi:MAG: ADP-glyceromanno-heptose 6-epimerase [Proteobacteria bacterium]|nr:ADP-glyceromanno-heptose 6-epimerase [Pseudomonadota bacterium]
MKLKDSRIIVTGGAGFIGSNLVKSLNEHGHKNIIIVDHLTNSGKWKNLVDLKLAYYFDRNRFLETLNNNQLNDIETIIHLGACSNTTETNEDFLIYNNAIFSKILFDFSIKNKCRFIYASSAATYGDGSKGYNDKERILTPLNCYGYSKHLFDQWVLDSPEKPKQCVGLKFFNVFGPNEYHKGQMASVVYHGYNQIIKDGEIRLFKSYKEGFEDGEQKRDFIYVKDALKVILFFLHNESKSGIFNVGTGEARTFFDLAASTFKALNLKPNIRFIEMPESLKGKYQYFTEADMSSLKKIGYDKILFELEEGVKDYVQNYLVHL